MHSCNPWKNHLRSVTSGKVVREVLSAPQYGVVGSVMCWLVQSYTRQHNIDHVLGIIGGELDEKQLPSNEDIIKACMLEEKKLKSTLIHPSGNVIKANVSSSVIDI